MLIFTHEMIISHASGQIKMKTAPGPPWRPVAVAYGMVSGDHLGQQPYYNQKAPFPPNWRNGHSESAVLKVPYGIG
jgi:hypothetical protein